MVNSGDLFVCLVAGLAIPLAIVDGLKAFGGKGHRQLEGLLVERFIVEFVVHSDWIRQSRPVTP